MTNDIVPAHLAVQAMRDNGYKNAAYAIAELIDNSIQAGASQVELLCAERSELVEQRRRNRIHQIGVLDNGSGMDGSTLKISLQFGNGTHLTRETQTGMGRFGMGLPSASISQCTRVEVWSWQDGPDSALYTYLDVDEIRQRKQVGIPDAVPRAIPKVWRAASAGLARTGTLVVWSNLDRILWRKAETIIDNSEFLIGRLYRRFIHSNQVRIRLAAFDADNPKNIDVDKDMLPNDPGYLMDRTSCPEPFQNTAMFRPWGEEARLEIAFRGEKHPVTVRFSYALEEARLGNNPGAKPHGQHARKNVGISIVRAGRELDLDQSWVIQYDPVERWWGIEVEFPPGLDELFGVTNNKQAARNFENLAKLDLDTLYQGNSATTARQLLAEEEDPREPLLELAHRIRTNLSTMRSLLTRQTKGRNPRKRHDSTLPEAIATAATRELQKEGHRGASDKDEQLPKEQRQSAIEKTLVDEGVPVTTAKELAARTISDGLKFLYAEADLETPSFFTVKPRGGAIVLTLNTNHPAYEHLMEVLNKEDASQVDTNLRERLQRASDGLKLLLSAWARYEDEQPDGTAKTRAQEARSDWGKIARRFLEREE